MTDQTEPDPADLTGYLAPDPPIGCLTGTTEHPSEPKPVGTTVTDPAWLQAQYAEAIKSVRLRLTPDPIVTTLIQAGSGFHLKDEEAWPFAAAVLRVRDRHLEQLRQRLTLTLADTELGQRAENESADAAAGSYAGRAEEVEAQLARVIDLYEQWVKAGPPPLGVSTARWWDRRLVELHDAIHPAAEQPRTTPNNPAGT